MLIATRAQLEAGGGPGTEDVEVTHVLVDIVYHRIQLDALRTTIATWPHRGATRERPFPFQHPLHPFFTKQTNTSRPPPSHSGLPTHAPKQNLKDQKKKKNPNHSPERTNPAATKAGTPCTNRILREAVAAP
jgi:hypothetical protein